MEKAKIQNARIWQHSKSTAINSEYRFLHHVMYAAYIRVVLPYPCVLNFRFFHNWPKVQLLVYYFWQQNWRKLFSIIGTKPNFLCITFDRKIFENFLPPYDCPQGSFFRSLQLHPLFKLCSFVFSALVIAVDYSFTICFANYSLTLIDDDSIANVAECVNRKPTTECVHRIGNYGR